MRRMLAVIGLVVLVGCGGGEVSAPAPDDEATTSTSTTEAATTTTTPRPQVAVPTVQGLRLDLAERNLRDAGLTGEEVDVGDVLGGGLGAGVWEPMNWWVVAQCPEGGTAPFLSSVQLAVIQGEDYSDDLRSLVGRGELPDPLDCA